MLAPPGLPRISRRQAEAGRFFDARPPVVQRILRSRESSLLLSGPLGTGKTRIALERVRACCLKYPGCRWLMARSIRKWMTNSALVTWEEKVVVPGELRADRIQRANRSEYRFKNGSVVVVAGLDDSVAVRSAEYDGAFILEATEIGQETKDEVAGRLRNGVMPYQQLIMDCNPGAPTHWLKQDVDAGRLAMIDTTHRDNPFLFSQDTQDWTRQGADYLARLDTFTGVRRLRLKDGRWAKAEGVVYENYDARIHVVDPFPIPAHWRRYWAIDFGYTNPLCWQFWAEDPDGRIYLYREIYQTKRLVRDVAEWVGRLTEGEPRPEDAVGDHDPEALETIRSALGVTVKPADKSDKKGGIQEVTDRLKIQGDGKPRLMLFRNAIAHIPSIELREAGKPTSTEGEFDSYCFVAGTMVETSFGRGPIEQIRAGQMVWTRWGLRRVLKSGCTHKSARVVTAKLSNGRLLTGTANHPVFTVEKGWIPLSALSCKDILLPWNPIKPESFSTESSTTDGRTGSDTQTGCISAAAPSLKPRGSAGSMSIFGDRFTETYLKGVTSITEMETTLTIPSVISSVSPRRAMSMRTGETLFAELRNGLQSSPAHENSQRNLNALQREELFAGSSQRKFGRVASRRRRSANGAESFFSLGRSGKPDSVPADAIPSGGTPAGLITKSDPAPTAEPHSASINPALPNAAPVRVLSITAEPRLECVYNLSVEEHREYFASGVLVHNCWNPRLTKNEEPLKVNDHGADAARYICRLLGARDSGGPFGGYGAPEPEQHYSDDTFR
jgi:PBSX family phage terminase large subunit